MTTWIALLRGINVSGQRKITMADLRALHEGLGHADVATYIQSGNVAFSSPVDDRGELGSMIETAISNRFGFDVPVILRTSSELDAVAAANPYIPAGSDERRVAVAFFQRSPDPSARDLFDPAAHEPDVCVLDGAEAHLHCPAGFGRTKLTNAYLERELGVTATTRNWRTVARLAAMSESA